MAYQSSTPKMPSIGTQRAAARLGAKCCHQGSGLFFVSVQLGFSDGASTTIGPTRPPDYPSKRDRRNMAINAALAR